MTRVGKGKPIEVATREIVMSRLDGTRVRVRRQNSPQS